MKFVKNILLGISLIVFVASCDNPIIGDQCNEDKAETSLLVDRKIMDSLDIGIPNNEIEHFRIISGSNLVAVYNFSAAQCDNVFDDEYGYFYAIEIEREANSFSFVTNDLDDARHYFYEWGAWVPAKVTLPVEGSISGTRRSDNRWDISADLKVVGRDSTNTFNLKFDESFSK